MSRAGKQTVNASRNLLLETVEYQTEKTPRGIWRRHLSEQGRYFAEFTSHASWLGLPLLHYTNGIDPRTGRRKTATGVVAVGRRALGIVAFGQLALGVVAIGQAGLGLLLGLGQLATGAYALGQVSVGALFAMGQVALAQTAVAQLGAGYFVLAQLGIGKYVWSTQRSDPQAVAYFQDLARQLLGAAGGG